MADIQTTGGSGGVQLASTSAGETVLTADFKKKHDSVVAGSSSSSSTGSSTRLCQVCDDNASGFHYGVWSCEGCKAFFKRSIQGPVDYVCPATNSCTIDKHRRKSCQACRLRKCYEVGMNKGSQRKERKNSSNQSKAKRSSADFSDSTVNSTSGNQPAKSQRLSKSSSLVEELSKNDFAVPECKLNPSIPLNKNYLLQLLIQVADKDLVQLINWAKHIPGYADLSLSDQVHLIECCWMELVLLNCAYRSMEHEGKRLAFASNLILERHHWEMLGMTQILEQVAAVSEQLLQFGINREELLLLEATILVNAEVRRLAGFSKIDDIRQIILNALIDTAQKYHPDNPRHVPSALLLLSHVRQASDRSITYLQKQKDEGHVTFCELIREMLEAQNILTDIVAPRADVIGMGTWGRKNIAKKRKEKKRINKILNESELLGRAGGYVTFKDKNA